MGGSLSELLAEATGAARRGDGEAASGGAEHGAQGSGLAGTPPARRAAGGGAAGRAEGTRPERAPTDGGVPGERRWGRGEASPPSDGGAVPPPRRGVVPPPARRRARSEPTGHVRESDGSYTRADGERRVSLQLKMDPEAKRALKVQAAEAGLSPAEYVALLVREDGRSST